MAPSNGERAFLVASLVQAEIARDSFDTAVRQACYERPLEGLFMSAKAMLTGVGIKCALMPRPGTGLDTRSRVFNTPKWSAAIRGSPAGYSAGRLPYCTKSRY
jgi:hypothetical protein